MAWNASEAAMKGRLATLPDRVHFRQAEHAAGAAPGGAAADPAPVASGNGADPSCEILVRHALAPGCEPSWFNDSLCEQASTTAARGCSALSATNSARRNIDSEKHQRKHVKTWGRSTSGGGRNGVAIFPCTLRVTGMEG